nr:hypothetical protein [uncultured Cohaesibacter sp.]
MSADGNNKNSWDGFLKALNTEPRIVETLTGISGIEHSISALGVDDVGQRVIIVADQVDAKSAALMQADIQATFNTGINVLVTRPVYFSLPKIADVLSDFFGSSVIDVQQINNIPTEELKAFLEPIAPPIEAAFRNFKPNILPQILQAVPQVSLLQIGKESSSLASFEDGEATISNYTLDLAGLQNHDLTAADREFGVCGVPFYQFPIEKIELLNSNEHVEDIAQLLKDEGVFQYFFPTADQTALSLVDRGMHNETIVNSSIQRAGEYGHIITGSELVPSLQDIADTVSELKDLGYVADGEFGVEVTDDGKMVRSMIKFKPREGFVSRLMNRVSIKLDMKDFLGGTGL